jgi:hypothetical protein
LLDVDPGQVPIDAGPPRLGVELLDRRRLVETAGAVGEDIETAPALDDGGDGGVHVGFRGAFSGDEHRLAAIRFDVLHGGFAGLPVAVDDGDLGAFGGEALGARQTDAGGPASDRRNLSFNR